MAKCNGILITPLLTRKQKVFINVNLPYKNQHSNIPSFHYSRCEAESVGFNKHQ